MNRAVLLGPLLLLPGGCAGEKTAPDDFARAKAMQVTSTAFRDGETIPGQYTADGKNVSPPVRWAGAPKGVKSFAVICEDPDAPRGTWIHWVLFNVPADRHELPEAVPADQDVLQGARQGTNSFKKIGYGGPDPPRGKPHHYLFKVYALDATLDLPAGATQEQLVTAMQGHVLAQGQLTGLYGRIGVRAP